MMNRLPITDRHSPGNRMQPRLPRATLRLLLASTALLFASSPVRAQDEPIPPQVQTAVDRGLDWLAHAQDLRTGGWNAGSDRGGATAAVTSLAAMAFMARGHVPGQGPFGENINRAVDHILALQQPDGTLAAHAQTPTMYDHGISTVMLCEAYGMLDEKRQKSAHSAISNAVRLILRAQAIPKSAEFRGGWRYLPTATDADISVTGWQLMALRGAANIGANVPASAIDDGIAYIKRRADRQGGFGYINGRANAALTGTGIVSLELLGQHHSKEALAGGDYLLTKGGKQLGLEWHFYTVYYCSQAAWQLGGRYWQALNPFIRQSLLTDQRADGSWLAGSTEQQGGSAYATSMAVLALSVPYRYLPIYQK